MTRHCNLGHLAIAVALFAGVPAAHAAEATKAVPAVKVAKTAKAAPAAKPAAAPTAPAKTTAKPAAAAKASKTAKNCTMLAAVGSGLNKAIAEVMANGGLKTIANSRGYTPEGPVKMSCKDGTLLTECRAQGRVCK